VTTYTLIWPPDTRVGLPRDRWRRLEDGRIEAVYNSDEELGLCLMFARINGINGQNVAAWRAAIVRGWEALRVPEDGGQGTLL
jgi:hypothetical protein